MLICARQRELSAPYFARLRCPEPEQGVEVGAAILRGIGAGAAADGGDELIGPGQGAGVGVRMRSVLRCMRWMIRGLTSEMDEAIVVALRASS
jgi:hypothetical protein